MRDETALLSTAPDPPGGIDVDHPEKRCRVSSMAFVRFSLMRSADAMILRSNSDLMEGEII